MRVAFRPSAIAPLLLLLLLAFPDSRLRAQAPVAGIDSNSITVELLQIRYDYVLQGLSTASGSIDSMRYTCYNTLGQVMMTNLLTGNPPGFTLIVSNPYSITVRLQQIAYGPQGTDTAEVLLPVDCQHVTPPLSYWVTISSTSSPIFNVTAYSTDPSGDRDIRVSGPNVISLGDHFQSYSGWDTVSGPGPVYVCALYYNSTCTQFQYMLCDTFNISCFGPPTVSFVAVPNGFSVNFFSTVTTANPHGYVWDFGDGQTSVDANPSHTYSQPGTYLPCLTVTDSCGTTTYCLPNAITITGVADMAQDWQVQMVPSHGKLEINGRADVRFSEVRVYNMLGQPLPIANQLGATWSLPQTLYLPHGTGTYVLELVSIKGERFRRPFTVTD
ncbi:MAG: PKD domain-containing protein [Bacteroidia bacterium]